MQKTSTENSRNQQLASQSAKIVEKTAVEAAKNMRVIKAHNITTTTQLEILQISVSSLHTRIQYRATMDRYLLK